MGRRKSENSCKSGDRLIKLKMYGGCESSLFLLDFSNLPLFIGVKYAVKTFNKFIYFATYGKRDKYIKF